MTRLKLKYLAFAVTMSLLAFSSCSEKEGNTTKNPDKEVPDDTIGMEKQVLVEVKQEETFGEKSDRLMHTIFADYKEINMDPMDAFPKFKSAKKEKFERIRRKTPVSNEYGSGVYINILFKSYHFGDDAALKKDVEEWLNGHESSDDQIELGENVNALKSPPLLCAVIGTDYFMVQSGCIYNSKEWDESKALFIETMQKEEGAKYVFEVTCQAGKMVYHLGGK